MCSMVESINDNSCVVVRYIYIKENEETQFKKTSKDIISEFLSKTLKNKMVYIGYTVVYWHTYSAINNIIGTSPIC